MLLRRLSCITVLVVDHIDRYQNSTAQNSKRSEHIAQHPQKAQKDNSVEPNERDQVVFLPTQQGQYPAKIGASKARWRLLRDRELGPRRIDELICERKHRGTFHVPNDEDA